jgi:hypothetical protein
VQSKEKYPNILTEFVGTLFNTTAWNVLLKNL